MYSTREHLSDTERARLRSLRLREMKRKKQRQEQLRRLALPAGIGLLVCVVLIIAVARGFAVRARRRGNPNNTRIEQEVRQTPQEAQPSEPSETQAAQLSGAPVLPQASMLPDVSALSESAVLSVEGALSGAASSESAGLSGEAASGAVSSEPEAPASGEGGSSENKNAGGMLAQAGVYSMERMQADYESLLSASAPLTASATEATITLGEGMFSRNVVFINASEGTVLAQKDAWTRIPPASMTKILTVLVAAEHVADFEDTFTMTQTAADYGYLNDCTSIGFVAGEEVAVRDLFYGTVLKSGADAAVGLAEYTAGSHEAFVALMNEKLEQLGLSDTAHFTNCVGAYDSSHYCTVYDMAVIMKAAYDNPFCREVLSAHTYTTGSTPQHPEGIAISNWFLRRIEDKDTHEEVLCAKTGYVTESEHCAASLLVGGDGTVYICATVHAPSVWRCIEDHTALYQRFVP